MLVGVVVLWVLCVVPAAGQESYSFKVLPSEAKHMTDPETGTDLVFLTTDPGHDQNLYYEQRSWLADESMILFNSGREGGGLMGYITATGELACLTTPKGGLGGPTAAKEGNRIFAMRGAEVVELTLDVKPGRVTASERVICTLGPENMSPNTAITENADGTKLAMGVGGRGAANAPNDGKVIVIDVKSGQVDEVFRIDGAKFDGHVVFSRQNPKLISFYEQQSWISVADIRTKEVVFRQKKAPGEFATHHCWWVGDTITFCGGFHPQPTEDADVKVIDVHSGEVRIVGKGAWWPGATSAELARQNWWHSCGFEGGRWIAADNWYGDIGIFHAGTTRTYILTKGHRTYGKGSHPEVGWDRRGEQVVFTSDMLGDANVCVATIPKAWQDDWSAQMSGK
jgi:hypothetical protein